MHSIAGKRPTKTPCSCVQLTARFQKPNPQQLEFIRAAVARMPVSSEIISATETDADGGKQGVKDGTSAAATERGSHSLLVGPRSPRLR